MVFTNFKNSHYFEIELYYILSADGYYVIFLFLIPYFLQYQN
jgi:hypothetical protein